MRLSFINGSLLEIYYLLLWTFLALVFLSVFMLRPLTTEVMRIRIVQRHGDSVVHREIYNILVEAEGNN